MSETTKPRHHEDAGFLRRSADRMADAIERLVLLGRLDSRSEAADAALDYRNPQFARLDRIEALEAERNTLRNAIGVMVPIIIESYLRTCDPADRQAVEATRDRVAAAMKATDPETPHPAAKVP